MMPYHMDYHNTNFIRIEHIYNPKTGTKFIIHVKNVQYTILFNFEQKTVKVYGKGLSETYPMFVLDENGNETQLTNDEIINIAIHKIFKYDPDLAKFYHVKQYPVPPGHTFQNTYRFRIKQPNENDNQQVITFSDQKNDIKLAISRTIDEPNTIRVNTTNGIPITIETNGIKSISIPSRFTNKENTIIPLEFEETEIEEIHEPPYNSDNRE